MPNIYSRGQCPNTQHNRPNAWYTICLMARGRYLCWCSIHDTTSPRPHSKLWHNNYLTMKCVNMLCTKHWLRGVHRDCSQIEKRWELHHSTWIILLQLGLCFLVFLACKVWDGQIMLQDHLWHVYYITIHSVDSCDIQTVLGIARTGK